MHLPHPLLLLLLLACHTHNHLARAEEESTGKCLEQRVMDMERATSQLMRQLTLQQLYLEESTRATYDSGIKQIRRRSDGPKSYFAETNGGRSMIAMHNHDNNIRTVGMGEFVALLNGIEFRTRHNDFRLQRPSTTSGDYQAVEGISFPDVPPAVKGTVEEQGAELKEWFKAWLSGDHSVRDYRPYFRPNLCYLEGFWNTQNADGAIDEPFESDRHHIEADTWFELQEKIRFTSYMGDKNLNENFAYLPTTILSTENGIPVFGQWNYRILCHPIRGDLNLSRFQPIDNLGNRLARFQGNTNSYERYIGSRAARFRLDSLEGDEDFKDKWSLLDDLMYEIPGLNNYMANITDESFGEQKRQVLNPNTPLNTGYYHRVYRVPRLDAMGENVNFKGYSDRFLFVSENTQAKVAPMSIPFCRTKMQRKNDQCETVTKRMSYAIPLEILFTTPLQSWNPYNLQYKGEYDSEEGLAVTADGRDGSTPEKAMNGIHSKLYLLTPNSFYSADDVNEDTADTSKGKTYVLDPSNTPQGVTTSGVRVTTRDIPGLGKVRLRYAILPVSGEGHSAWKEVEALRDVVMDMGNNLLNFPTPPPLPEEAFSNVDPDKAVRLTLMLEPADNATTYQDHSHIMDMTKEEFQQVKQVDLRKDVIFRTSKTNGHSHELMVYFDKGEYRVRFCDQQAACYDGHPSILTVVPDS